MVLLGYKLSVHLNEEDDGKQLCVSHTPAMQPDECRCVGLTIHSEHLSIETLLMQTIEVRTRAKLKVNMMLASHLSLITRLGQHCQGALLRNIVRNSLQDSNTPNYD